LGTDRTGGPERPVFFARMESFFPPNDLNFNAFRRFTGQNGHNIV
jgi:hypothetical protein